MYLGFSSMNTVKDPNPAVLAKILEQAGFRITLVWRTQPYPDVAQNALSAGW
jgi:hypothetical protein